MNEKIFGLIAACTDKKDFDEDSDLQLDLGLDSFQLMSLTLEIEKTFDIKIDLADMSDILTVGDICRCVEKTVASQHPKAQ